MTVSLVSMDDDDHHRPSGTPALFASLFPKYIFVPLDLIYEDMHYLSNQFK